MIYLIIAVLVEIVNGLLKLIPAHLEGSEFRIYRIENALTLSLASLSEKIALSGLTWP